MKATVIQGRLDIDIGEHAKVLFFECLNDLRDGSIKRYFQLNTEPAHESIPLSW